MKTLSNSITTLKKDKVNLLTAEKLIASVEMEIEPIRQMSREANQRLANIDPHQLDRLTKFDQEAFQFRILSSPREGEVKLEPPGRSALQGAIVGGLLALGIIGLVLLTKIR